MRPSSWITTSVERAGEVAVLAVRGVIDLATGPALQDAIDSVFIDGVTVLIVDLSEVTFMASTGLSILASTHERLSGPVGLVVVADSAPTRRPIQLTGLDKVFAVCSTLDDGLRHVRNYHLNP